MQNFNIGQMRLGNPPGRRKAAGWHAFPTKKGFDSFVGFVTKTKSYGLLMGR